MLHEVRSDDNQVGGNIEAAFLILLEHFGVEREVENGLLILRQQLFRQANLRFNHILENL